MSAATRLKTVFEKASGLTKLHEKGLKLNRAEIGASALIGYAGLTEGFNIVGTAIGTSSLFAISVPNGAVGLAEAFLIAAGVGVASLAVGAVGGIAMAVVANRLISHHKIHKQERAAKKAQPAPAPSSSY